MSDKCPICGTPGTVVGDITKHFVADSPDKQLQQANKDNAVMKDALDSDSLKLIMLADRCSDLILGGESGWMVMDFKEFVDLCGKTLGRSNKALNHNKE